MLFSPKWETQAEINRFRSDLLAWLAAQPEQSYDFKEPENCLIARYIRHLSVKDQDRLLSAVGVKHQDRLLSAEQIDALVGNSNFLIDDPQTYSGALERARASLS
jgi:hypothetical protein